MERALSDREIARLLGPDGAHLAKYVESATVSDESDLDERSRRYTLRVHGVTGTFCASYFAVDVIELSPDRSLVEWFVELPNRRSFSLSREERDGGLLERRTHQLAVRGLVTHALGWGRAFGGVVPEGMTDAVVHIAGMVTELEHQLMVLKPHTGDLPDDARMALSRALRIAQSLQSGLTALQALVGCVVPVKHPQY